MLRYYENSKRASPDFEQLLASNYLSYGHPIKGAVEIMRLHPCGTAALLSAALDRGPTYGKRSRKSKQFKIFLFIMIWRKGSLLVSS
jgi:hypothetical protein